MDKIIFLDVDGVLNSEYINARSPEGHVGVMDSKVKLLSKLVEETNADVVISSDWRLIKDADYQYLINKLRYKGHIEIKGETPNLSWSHRGTEIKSYLDDHPTDAWVVLDDIVFSDFEIVEGHLVLTDPEFGLTEADVEKAKRILEGE